MKRTLAAIFPLLFPVLLLSADKTETGVLLTMTIGPVRTKPTENGRWSRAAVNKPLQASAVIQTGEKARARVRFLDDNSEMILPEGKTVSVASLLAKRLELRQDDKKLKLNRIKARFSRQSNPGEAAPTAVAGVRGSDASKTSPAKEPEEFIWED